jgi:hypothetical protein
VLARLRVASVPDGARADLAGTLADLLVMLGSLPALDDADALRLARTVAASYERALGPLFHAPGGELTAGRAADAAPAAPPADAGSSSSSSDDANGQSHAHAAAELGDTAPPHEEENDLVEALVDSDDDSMDLDTPIHAGAAPPLAGAAASALPWSAGCAGEPDAADDMDPGVAWRRVAALVRAVTYDDLRDAAAWRTAGPAGLASVLSTAVAAAAEAAGADPLKPEGGGDINASGEMDDADGPACVCLV